MSELPNGWVSAPIGSLCTLLNGRAFKPTEWAATGVPIVRIQNLNSPEASHNHYRGEISERHQLRGGELLFAWSGTPGTSFGAHIWHGKEAVLNQHIFRVDFDSALLDKRFFRFAINEKLNELIGVAQGGVGLRHVTKGVFEGTEVVVPPRAEQTRIADLLDTLLLRIDACRELIEAIPSLLKRFRLAVLDAATTGALSEEWRASDSAPWPFVTLEEHANGFSYGSASKSERSGRVPVLRMGNIQGGRLDWADLVYTSNESEIKKYELKKGDVLFNRTNSPELVGKTAVYQGEQPAIYAGYLIRVRCKDDLLPEFLTYCLGSTAGRNFCWAVKSDGVSQSNINAKKLRAFKFHLPKPEEQHEIVRRAESLFRLADRIEARYQAMRVHSQRLAPQALAKAFRGELVQQNPQDEPASILLQRIAGKQPEKLKTTRGRPRLKNPEAVGVPQVTLPDWSTLPAGAWAAQVPADEHSATAQLTAVLKAWNKPMPQDTARLATLLCLQPRLLTAALPAEHATQWRRLVGDAAAPLPAQVVTLQLAFNTPWRNAISKMRARGDLVETGSGAQGTWALGPDAARVDTVGCWPEGRAGWVVHYLQTHGVEAVLPTLATEVQEFVHARAA